MTSLPALLLSLVAAVVLMVVGVLQRQPLVFAIGASSPFLAVLLTAPVLRRFAVRNVVRHPRETVLIVLGAMLGTSIITSAQVVGDSLQASVHQTVYTQLGPVDEVVQQYTTPAWDADEAATEAAQRDSLLQKALSIPQVDGAMWVTEADGALAVQQPTPRALPDARVLELDFAKARAFGNDPAATGISGTTPAPGHAVVTETAANRLGIHPGGLVEVYVGGQHLRLTVDDVVAQKGLAGLAVDSGGSASYNVLVAPGTLASAAATWASQHPDQLAAPTKNVLLVSNVGGVESGAEHSEAVGDALATVVGSSSFDVQLVKHDRIRDAKVSGRILALFFDAIGGFSIAAGVLLLINIFWMLAQERQTELGIFRAIGMRRKSMIGGFGLEGWFYAIGAALVGTLAGVGIGRAVVGVADRVFSNLDTEAFRLNFHVEPISLQWGFSAGLLISLLTVTIASVLVSRMNVIAAIRDLPNVVSPRQRVLGAGCALLLATAGAYAWSIGHGRHNDIAVITGPVVLGLGLLWFLKRFRFRRIATTVVAAALLVWMNVASKVDARAFRHTHAAIYGVEALVTIFAAVALISVHHDKLGKLARHIGRGPQALALRIGMTYPVIRPGRTALLITMYSLVTFVVTLSMVIGHVLTTQVDSQLQSISGGADLFLQHRSDTDSRTSGSASALPVDEIAHRPDVERATLVRKSGGYIGTSTSDVESLEVFGIGNGWFQNGAPKVKHRGAQYADDAAMWAALAHDPSSVVVDRALADQGHGIGTTLELRNGDDEPGSSASSSDTGAGATSGGRRTVKVVGVVDADEDGDGKAYLSADAFTSLYGTDRPADERLYVRTKAGTDPTAIAAQLSGLYVDRGYEAMSFREMTAKIHSTVTQFLRLVQGYLAIGLLAGIAGLGVVMVRAVRERRRQIGVLRAIGLPAYAVRRAFLFESGFVAFEGTVIGLACGLGLCWRLFNSTKVLAGVSMSVPWLLLAGMLIAILVASLLATLAPARSASRIRPAIVLRSID